MGSWTPMNLWLAEWYAWHMLKMCFVSMTTEVLKQSVSALHLSAIAHLYRAAAPAV
jgi:hypothetical protein